MKINCEKMQELLITDYTDGELDFDARLAVDRHLGSCAACREFASAVRVNAREPIAAALKITPPAYILERVKAEISTGKEERFGFSAHAGAIAQWVTTAIANIPRPVVAFAATAIVIIAIVISRPMDSSRVLNEYLGEQINYIANLDGEEVNGAAIYDTDIRTGAERLL